MDDEVAEIIENPTAWKHDRWSFIVLAVDLAHSIASDITDTLSAATAALMQHRQHKIEENRFYEITGE